MVCRWHTLKTFKNDCASLRRGAFWQVEVADGARRDALRSWTPPRGAFGGAALSGGMDAVTPLPAGRPAAFGGVARCQSPRARPLMRPGRSRFFCATKKHGRHGGSG